MKFLIILLLLCGGQALFADTECNKTQIESSLQLVANSQLVCPDGALELSNDELCNTNKYCVDYIKEIINDIPNCIHNGLNLNQDAETLIKKCNESASASQSQVGSNSANSAIVYSNILLLMLFLIQIHIF